MISAALLALLAASPAPSEPLWRAVVAEVALAQVQQPDPRWIPEQRDCAGLVRFAYRSALRRLRPRMSEAALWRTAGGERLHFADAETLLLHSFAPLGRGQDARRGLRSGDLLAFRQETARGPAFHLMLVVQPAAPAHAATRVVYHPGQPGAAVRLGTLDALSSEAPREWRPSPENTAFLGFYRFKEWMHD